MSEHDGAERLKLDRKSAWEQVEEEEKEKIFDIAEQYKMFLDNGKTERENINQIMKMGLESGFSNVDNLVPNGEIKPGTKFFKTFHNKAMVMGIVGQQGFKNGFKLVGSHVDSPRLDLKPNPLYEHQDLALFKTHYYGGIKKYQWATIPLALHGVVLLKSGEKVEIVIGEEETDPIFTITDVLPHLGKEQAKRKFSEGIKGEELNILVGSIPLPDTDVKEKIKLSVLDYLNKNYGMIEEDFISSELEMVPAGKARDIGFDRGLVGAYGQDDRICAFSSFKAIAEIDSIPEKTAVCLFADKEEIGSTGNTGMQSRVLEEVVSELSNSMDENIPISKIFYDSEALSADVNAALDPTWEGVMDSLNAAKLGYGVCLTKYTGSRGKANANDAHAEFVAQIRKILSENNITWQVGELGKVDEGGGGTIAQFLSNLNINVVDCGMPILSMHAPFEVSSKVDLFMGYRTYKSFLS